jgi:hypothetical protein
MARPRLLPDPVGLKFVNLEAPPDWDTEFGFSGPLELEMGSGAGGHALEYCRRNPQVRYVAFEWRKKYARDTWSRGEKLGLKNLRVIEADARAVVPRIFGPESLSAIHLQFPDPWWTIWNLSCTDWRLSGDLPMRPWETRYFTVTLPNEQRIEVLEAVVRWSKGQEFAVEILL